VTAPFCLTLITNYATELYRFVVVEVEIKKNKIISLLTPPHISHKMVKLSLSLNSIYQLVSLMEAKFILFNQGLNL